MVSVSKFLNIVCVLAFCFESRTVQRTTLNMKNDFCVGIACVPQKEENKHPLCLFYMIGLLVEGKLLKVVKQMVKRVV